LNMKYMCKGIKPFIYGYILNETWRSFYIQ
jgi:hypothetical protein